MIQTGFEKRVTVQQVIENQLPEFILSESPKTIDFLKQYYISQEHQGGALDIAVNLDQYLKVDNLTPEVISGETTLYSGIHHYKSREVRTTDGTIIIASGEKVGVGQSVSYYDDALGQHVRATDVAIPVTNYEHEDNLNNKKREIFILKPEYLSVVFDDINEIMRYKKGSTQYLSETLVRGDNIRLYD